MNTPHIGVKALPAACDGTIGRAVATYTEREVVEIEVARDPIVVGAFAVRATVRRSTEEWWSTDTLDFLITGVPLQDVSENDLEEVYFTSWPPVSTGRPCVWRLS